MKSFVCLISLLLWNSVASAGNPLVKDIFTADPEARVFGDRLYVYTSHDQSDATYWYMTDWRLLSTADMNTWKDHGPIFSLKGFAWASRCAWAPDCVEVGGKYYLVLPVDRTKIGVAVSDSPEGPFKDAIGNPLIETTTVPNTGIEPIDPATLVDDDGKIYLYFGCRDPKVVKIDPSMTKLAGSVQNVELLDPQGQPILKAVAGTQPELPQGYGEAPFVFKREGKYYFVYSNGWANESTQVYAIGTSPLGPFTYAGKVMEHADSVTQHGSIVQFHGKWYLFYHTSELSNGNAFRRSVCVDELTFDSDGKINIVTPTKNGADPIASLHPSNNFDQILLGDLGVDAVHQDWGQPRIDKSVGNNPLSVGGTKYAHGIGTHAASKWIISTNAHSERFKAMVGVDDEVAPENQNRLSFVVKGDGRTLFSSGEMVQGDAAIAVDVDLRGIKQLVLQVIPEGGISFCHADWLDATISYSDVKPISYVPPIEPAIVLTPQAPPTPRINGAKVVGVRVNHPLLYTMAVTGDRPMTFAADNLPNGLIIDSETGNISGSVAAAGKYVVNLHATNSLGSADRDLRIEVGDHIALTPPMGWNSWNCFAGDVSDEKVRAAADAMVKSGLINHGWTYINIDDCWEIRAQRPLEQRRGPDGHILTNSKFPDMKQLADYVHSKGMRIGLYSSPGPSTCGGFTASYQFEQADAKQYANWGFDYLKYDWCSYGDIAKGIKANFNSSADLDIDQHPYAMMRDALAKQNRDILFSFCQYGMGDVWKWGDAFGGNCWRTTGDIIDSWDSMSGIGFNQNGHEQYAGPGHWNDPDMLVVGKVGWGASLHQTKLTPNEQYTHISLWSLLSAPLLIGCDMTQLDDFTKGLLTNDEVIAVDQDPLGKQASRISQVDVGLEIWAKDLEDGSKAVGLFNRGEDSAIISVGWSDLGLSGPQQVRDLWREKDLGVQQERFAQTVPRHGVVLMKVSPAAKSNH